ncbi:chaperonin 10-like protein [Lipomyces orientalis]|uniref:Chaperonin 10-like protein n=1 Tax=Lipomyces orientalis TaxID=1233043 RepID=A0ACC3TDX8_9ASCO
MPTKVKCLASLEAGKYPVPSTVARRDLRSDDIEIKILYCGICHSDIHHVRSNWGPDGYGYPVVPGHEIVGKVFRVGLEVSKFKVGDSVGVGCMVDSCQTCATCKNDREQYCNSTTFTYGSLDRRDGSRTYGGYTETIVVTEKFVLSIPETLDLAGAAPLLCAGITTYSPLRRWDTHPGSKVGVVGLGGLGHMALKLAKAMGADVTLFSRSQGKAEDAKRLGADQFVISSDPEQMKAVAGQFDLIIDTVPYNHDVNPYVKALVPEGSLVLVGYFGPLEPTVNSAPLVLRSQNLAGSLIGGIKETQEMLDFCGQHKIMSDIEVINARDLHSAYERLVKGDVMQRFVIDITTL